MQHEKSTGSRHGSPQPRPDLGRGRRAQRWQQVQLHGLSQFPGGPGEGGMRATSRAGAPSRAGGHARAGGVHGDVPRRLFSCTCVQGGFRFWLLLRLSVATLLLLLLLEVGSRSSGPSRARLPVAAARCNKVQRRCRSRAWRGVARQWRMRWRRGFERRSSLREARVAGPTHGLEATTIKSAGAVLDTECGGSSGSGSSSSSSGGAQKRRHPAARLQQEQLPRLRRALREAPTT
jgi:hypothetical protein